MYEELRTLCLSNPLDVFKKKFKEALPTLPGRFEIYSLCICCIYDDLLPQLKFLLKQIDKNRFVKNLSWENALLQDCFAEDKFKIASFLLTREFDFNFSRAACYIISPKMMRLFLTCDKMASQTDETFHQIMYYCILRKPIVVVREILILKPDVYHSFPGLSQLILKKTITRGHFQMAKLLVAHDFPLPPNVEFPTWWDWKEPWKKNYVPKRKKAIYKTFLLCLQHLRILRQFKDLQSMMLSYFIITVGEYIV